MLEPPCYPWARVSTLTGGGGVRWNYRLLSRRLWSLNTRRSFIGNCIRNSGVLGCRRSESSAPILPRFSGRQRFASQWVGTGRTAVLCLPIPPVVTVRAAFTAHGGRLVGPFSSSSGDMDLRGEFVDFPTYPRLREG
jgi:hypothetical protein